MPLDRPGAGERAVLFHMVLSDAAAWNDPDEFEDLVLSAGGEPLSRVTGQRATIHPRTFVGSGKVAEIAEAIALHQADLVLFNHRLSPSQERNLERKSVG